MSDHQYADLQVAVGELRRRGLVGDKFETVADLQSTVILHLCSVVADLTKQLPANEITCEPPRPLADDTPRSGDRPRGFIKLYHYSSSRNALLDPKSAESSPYHDDAHFKGIPAVHLFKLGYLEAKGGKAPFRHVVDIDVGDASLHTSPVASEVFYYLNSLRSSEVQPYNALSRMYESGTPGYIKVLEPGLVGGWHTVAGVLVADGTEPVDSIGHGSTAEAAIQMVKRYLTNEALRRGLTPVIVDG